MGCLSWDENYGSRKGEYGKVPSFTLCFLDTQESQTMKFVWNTLGF